MMIFFFLQKSHNHLDSVFVKVSVSSDYSDEKSFCKHGNSDTCMFIFHVGKDE